MKFKSLYYNADSPIHRIDPITKLWYCAFVVFIAALPGSFWIPSCCLLLSLSLFVCGRVFKKALTFFGFVSLILITVVIIQGAFGAGNKTVVFSVMGVSFYREGLTNGLKIVLRVYNIVGAFVLLVLTTKPSDLVDSLVEKGLSPRIGYVIVSVFQIIPQMASTVDTIMDAQRARGMETEGRLLTRMRAFIPLIGPVVLNSFIGTKERAMALEVRAFGSENPKTFLNERTPYPHTRVVRTVMVLAAAAAAVYSIFSLYY